MQFTRSSGVLLPVFSLPGAHHIGDLGSKAYQFVDFLKSAGQSIWQLLPLGPPARGNSPYSSISAFAGNAMLISCDELVDIGLLSSDQLAAAGAGDICNGSAVDYGKANAFKKPLLKAAFQAFCESTDEALRRDFDRFCKHNDYWLEDFTLFETLALETGEPNWSSWDLGLVRREPSAIALAKDRLGDQIEFAKFEQFVFSLQWAKLKKYANERGIQMYGDMPIFVAYESADVWANQELFCLDGKGRPEFVAGVPPDYFSATGQMWGNPLYHWERLAASNYEWWTRRFRQAFELFDILRIDHFRAFESYWEIPADADNAIAGRWREGPSEAPFVAAQESLGELPIIAEDLGLITDEVHQLRDRLKFPGMRVLQFGFDSDEDPYHRPDNYPQHSVGYTGTHDNETLAGWYQRRCDEAVDNHIVDRFTSSEGDNIIVELIRCVLDSKSDLAIIPMQDLLGLDNQARTNTPGEPSGNWNWRCGESDFGNELAIYLREWTTASGRA